MKKLITICLLIATTIIANAQTKPTKEETIAYINRLFESTVGKTAFNQTIIRSSFNYETYIYEYLPIKEGVNYTNTVAVTSLIKWENYSKVNFFQMKNSVGEWVNMEDLLSDLGYMGVYFSTNVLLTQNDDVKQYRDMVCFYYPLSKKENLKKAFERLAEIAKEENKDLFGN